MQFGVNRCKCTLLLSAPWQLKKTVTGCPKKQILIPNTLCHGFYALCNLQAGQARPAEPSPSAMEMPKWQVHFINWRPSVPWARTRNWKRKGCSRGGKLPFWTDDPFGWRAETMPAPGATQALIPSSHVHPSINTSGDLHRNTNILAFRSDLSFPKQSMSCLGGDMPIFLSLNPKPKAPQKATEMWAKRLRRLPWVFCQVYSSLPACNFCFPKSFPAFLPFSLSCGHPSGQFISPLH